MQYFGIKEIKIAEFLEKHLSNNNPYTQVNSKDKSKFPVNYIYNCKNSKINSLWTYRSWVFVSSSSGA